MPKRSTRSRRKNKLYSFENNSNKESLESSFSEISNSNSPSENESNDELQELKNELNSQLNELVFYKIEMPSSSSNKKIISCIEKIHEIFNKIYNENTQIQKNTLKNKNDNVDDDTKIQMLLEENINMNMKITSSDLSDLEKKENLNFDKNRKEKKMNLKSFNTFEVMKNFILFLLIF